MAGMNALSGAQIDARILRLLDLRRAVDAELSRLANMPRPNSRIVGKGEAACGTESGWFHHRRVTKTDPCPACRAARNAAERARYARRKRRQRQEVRCA